MNGKLGREARGPDQKIDLLRAAVGEDDALAVEPLDAGLDDGAPMDEVIDIGVAGGGMRLEQIVVGPLQAEAAMRADHDAHAPAIEQPHQFARQRDAAGVVDEHVGRLAEHRLGEEIVGAAHRVHDAPVLDRGIGQEYRRLSCPRPPPARACP